MNAQYQIQFQSEKQREAFEELLMSMGVAFREVKSSGVEEPEADYQTVDPALLEMTAADWENIRLGDADIEAGRTVPWVKVKQYLEANIQRLTESQDAT